MTEQILQNQNAHRSSFLLSCKVIFDITFGQTIRSKKTVFMLIVTFLPFLLAVCYRILAYNVRPEQAFSRIIMLSPEQTLSSVMTFYLQFLSTLVALFYGTALFADEIDNKTITYLFTRPVRKYSIMLGKFAAYISEVFLILIPPMLLTFLVIATDNRVSRNFADSLSLFGKQLGVTVLSLIVYGAIFTFFGTFLKRPVLFGLLLAFGWEKMAIVVPGTIRKFSVIHYLLSAFPGGTAARSFMRLPEEMNPSSPIFLSIIVLLAITSVFLGLSIFMIYHKEYRFE